MSESDLDLDCLEQRNIKMEESDIYNNSKQMDKFADRVENKPTRVKTLKKRGDEKKQNSHRKRKKPFGISYHNAQRGVDTNYIPPAKKYRFVRRQTSVLPSKFLLGGNISDPLNLNGLGSADNVLTPKSSPLPLPISVHVQGKSFRDIRLPIFIPRNPYDPLGLSEEIGTLQDVIAGVQTFNKHRKNRSRRKGFRKRKDSDCDTDNSDKVQIGAKAEVHDQGPEPIPSVDAARPELNQVREAVIIEDNISVQQDALSQYILSPKSPYKSETNEILSQPDEEISTDRFLPSSQSSDYLPISSNPPSPFILDTLDQNLITDMITLPFQSPSITNYSGPLEHYTEPFSPPPSQHLAPRRPTRLQIGPLYLSSQESDSTSRPLNINYLKSFHRKRLHKLDPIVSPVIPQPGMKRSRHYNHGQGNQKNPFNKSSSMVGNSEYSTSANKNLNKKYHPKDEMFQYGNYNNYYGHRNGKYVDSGVTDIRLRALKREWIEGKDVLDVGCNVGDITISLARDFQPRRVLGIDIDSYLIEAAKKSILGYVGRGPNTDAAFPNSFSTVYGPLQPPPAMGILMLGENERRNKSIPFPYNVTFQQENYVLESDEKLDSVTEEYDVVLCLSVTKWIHLNFGDEGLKRFFRRGFHHLRPGGLFILEPQPWSSYKKKKKLTEKIFENFKSIQLFPDQFQNYLLKIVGYTSIQQIGIPNHHLKGFKRPVFVFTKGIAVENKTGSTAVMLPPQ